MKSLNEYANEKSRSNLNEAMVQIKGTSKPSGADILAKIIIEQLDKGGYMKPGLDKSGAKPYVIQDISELIQKSTF